MNFQHILIIASNISTRDKVTKMGCSEKDNKYRKGQMILKHINITYARHRVESARLTYLGLVNHENDYIFPLICNHPGLPTFAIKLFCKNQMNCNKRDSCHETTYTRLKARKICMRQILVTEIALLMQKIRELTIIQTWLQ